MSITVFVALCILGCDFLLYAFFQWTYGEKRRSRPRRKPAQVRFTHHELPPPYLEPSRSASSSSTPGWEERLAYRTIVASFTPPPR